MGVEQTALVHTVTWWRNTGSDGFGGYTFAAPITIAGRWEESLDMLTLPNGDEVTSSARVFVDRDLSEGDYLGYGDLTANVTPINLDRAFIVHRFARKTDLRGARFVRWCLL